MAQVRVKKSLLNIPLGEEVYLNRKGIKGKVVEMNIEDIDVKSKFVKTEEGDLVEVGDIYHITNELEDGGRIHTDDVDKIKGDLLAGYRPKNCESTSLSLRLIYECTMEEGYIDELYKGYITYIATYIKNPEYHSRDDLITHPYDREYKSKIVTEEL